MVSQAALVLMRISQNKPSKRRQVGFTLIEVLVVLIAMALVSGLVLLSMQSSATDTDEASRRVLAELEVLRDRAIVGGAPWGVSVATGADGFGVYRYDRGGWRRQPLAPELSEALRALQLSLAPADDFDLPERDATGPELQLRGRSLARDEEPFVPQVVFNPTGDYTPFTLTLDGERSTAVLEGAGAGTPQRSVTAKQGLR